jgi:hypothetical protein
MNDLISEYKDIEHDIKRFKRLLTLIEDEIIKGSTLKIGDLVERDRGITSEIGITYRISSIAFDTDRYCLTYGIKLVDSVSDYDTYSCIGENELKKMEG